MVAGVVVAGAGAPSVGAGVVAGTVAVAPSFAAASALFLARAAEFLAAAARSVAMYLEYDGPSPTIFTGVPIEVCLKMTGAKARGRRMQP